MIDFRSRARASLKRAEAELAADSDARLSYAVLELRMAIEALTYDRARAYKDEIPPEEYATWQPRRVMQLLLSIEPHADADSTLSFGKEDTPGEPAKEMTLLGGEKVFNLKQIKESYDALGAFLHTPTLKQLQDGKEHDPAKVRVRCDEVAQQIEETLKSQVFNITLGSFAHGTCMRCKQPLRKRMPLDATEIDARCFGCGAPYKVKDAAPGEVHWIAKQTKVACPKDGCEMEGHLWDDEIKVGTGWTCPECKSKVAIVLGVDVVGQ